jgi:hypothetical protein
MNPKSNQIESPIGLKSNRTSSYNEGQRAGSDLLTLGVWRARKGATLRRSSGVGRNHEVEHERHNDMELRCQLWAATTTQSVKQTTGARHSSATGHRL